MIKEAGNGLFKVLILVLMEYKNTPWLKGYRYGRNRLNPCSNGIQKYMRKSLQNKNLMAS